MLLRKCHESCALYSKKLIIIYGRGSEWVQVRGVPVDVRPQPDDYRARTGHSLDVQTSKIYEQLSKTQIYAKNNGMKLNLSKTKLMLFNTCTSRDFMPDISLENIRIDLVEETKLLGVVLTSDLSWAANTQ